MKPPWYNGRMPNLNAKGRGFNPPSGHSFSSQIEVFMQNLGPCLFENHELCSLAHFGTVRLYIGEIYKLVRPIYT